MEMACSSKLLQVAERSCLGDTGFYVLVGGFGYGQGSCLHDIVEELRTFEFAGITMNYSGEMS